MKTSIFLKKNHAKQFNRAEHFHRVMCMEAGEESLLQLWGQELLTGRDHHAHSWMGICSLKKNKYE